MRLLQWLLFMPDFVQIEFDATGNGKMSFLVQSTHSVLTVDVGAQPDMKGRTIAFKITDLGACVRAATMAAMTDKASQTVHLDKDVVKICMASEGQVLVLEFPRIEPVNLKSPPTALASQSRPVSRPTATDKPKPEKARQRAPRGQDGAPTRPSRGFIKATVIPTWMLSKLNPLTIKSIAAPWGINIRTPNRHNLADLSKVLTLPGCYNTMPVDAMREIAKVMGVDIPASWPRKKILDELRHLDIPEDLA